MPTPDLLGPIGLAVALLIAVAALWRNHLQQDADVVDQRDRALAGEDAAFQRVERFIDVLEAATGVRAPK